MGGLLSALPLVLISVYLRQSRPGIFFFSVAYAAAAILTALIWREIAQRVYCAAILITGSISARFSSPRC